MVKILITFVIVLSIVTVIKVTKIDPCMFVIGFFVAGKVNEMKGI